MVTRTVSGSRTLALPCLGSSSALPCSPRPGRAWRWRIKLWARSTPWVLRRGSPSSPGSALSHGSWSSGGPPWGKDSLPDSSTHRTQEAPLSSRSIPRRQSPRTADVSCSCLCRLFSCASSPETCWKLAFSCSTSPPDWALCFCHRPCIRTAPAAVVASLLLGLLPIFLTWRDSCRPLGLTGHYLHLQTLPWLGGRSCGGAPPATSDSRGGCPELLTQMSPQSWSRLASRRACSGPWHLAGRCRSPWPSACEGFHAVPWAVPIDATLLPSVVPSPADSSRWSEDETYRYGETLSLLRFLKQTVTNHYLPAIM